MVRGRRVDGGRRLECDGAVASEVMAPPVYVTVSAPRFVPLRGYICVLPHPQEHRLYPPPDALRSLAHILTPRTNETSYSKSPTVFHWSHRSVLRNTGVALRWW